MGRAAGRRAPAPAKPPWNANFADDRPLDRAARAGGGKPAGDDALGATLPKFKQSVHVGDRVRDRLWPTMVAQWSFWIPVQYLNFRFTPVRHQLNVVLTTSVVWTAFLSYTFPQKEEAPSEEL